MNSALKKLPVFSYKYNLIFYYSSLDSTSLLHLMFNCIFSRLNNLLAKCMIRKLCRFDSIVEINLATLHLRHLYFACLKVNSKKLSLKCLQSLQLFHSLSLIPTSTLIRSYDDERAENVASPSENNSLSESTTTTSKNENFDNFEVLTTKCKTAWELYCLKKTFNLAKKLLCYEQIVPVESLIDESTHEVKDGKILVFFRF